MLHTVSSRHGKGSLGSLAQTRAVIETPIMKVWGTGHYDDCSLWCSVGDQHVADGSEH